MHGTFLFLIRTSENCDNINEKADEAISAFQEYENAHSDGNNYSQVLGITSSSREILSLCENDKIFLTPDNSTFKKDKWKASIKFSVELAQYDTMTIDTGKKIKAETAKSLTTYVKKVIKNKDRPYWMEGKLISTEMDTWFFTKKDIQLECLKSCIVGGFSRTLMTPYDFRCFDLRNETEQSGESRDVILWVDIHT